MLKEMLKMSENRTVTLSKHEVVLDIDTVDAIWEIAHGADGWNREFPDNETIKVLQSYEKKAHMYDQMLELLGFKPVNIVVEGGMVVEVNGLPADWQYYIDDRDCPPEIEDEELFQICWDFTYNGRYVEDNEVKKIDE